jgi:hypothetical protein
MAEAGVADRSANPLARLLECGVREADDREPGQARSDIDFDPDDPAIEADEGGRQQRGQHAATLSVEAHPSITSGCTAAQPGAELVSRG